MRVSGRLRQWPRCPQMPAAVQSKSAFAGELPTLSAARCRHLRSSGLEFEGILSRTTDHGAIMVLVLMRHFLCQQKSSCTSKSQYAYCIEQILSLRAK